MIGKVKPASLLLVSVLVIVTICDCDLLRDNDSEKVNSNDVGQVGAEKVEEQNHGAEILKKVAELSLDDKNNYPQHVRKQLSAIVNNIVELSLRIEKAKIVCEQKSKAEDKMKVKECNEVIENTILLGRQNRKYRELVAPYVEQ